MGKNNLSHVFECCKSKAEYQFSFTGKKEISEVKIYLKILIHLTKKLKQDYKLYFSDIHAQLHRFSKKSNEVKRFITRQRNCVCKDMLLSKSEVPQYSNVKSILQDLFLLLSVSISCNVRSHSDIPTGQVGGIFCKQKATHSNCLPASRSMEEMVQAICDVLQYLGWACSHLPMRELKFSREKVNSLLKMPQKKFNFPTKKVLMVKWLRLKPKFS